MFITHYNDQDSNQLPDLQYQKLLILCWRSFSESGRERVAFSFANIGNLYHIYEYLQPITTQINHDAKPKIIDALLMLIFNMGQGACRFLFCIWMQPIPHFWMYAFNSHSDYKRCKTKNRWHSFDSHFWDQAGSISILVLILKAANTSKKDNDIPNSIFCV